MRWGKKMEYKYDRDWILEPVGGDTGQAYIGYNDANNERVFLKRNSSPFLTILSMEGFAPKLKWTKRESNGDTMTAQDWVSGDVLSHYEVGQLPVVKLMHRYHHSDNLYNMLVRIDGDVYEPERFLQDYQTDLPADLANHSLLANVEACLWDTLSLVQGVRKTVCHGDINRRNFIRAEDNQLYLVDWEMVKIADPILDISQLLVQYVDFQNWEAWFELYGLRITDDIYLRIEWYSMLNLLNMIKKDFRENRLITMNHKILKLKHIYQNRYIQGIQEM
jgi:thiamine kinase-like enzyme